MVNESDPQMLDIVKYIIELWEKDETYNALGVMRQYGFTYEIVIYYYEFNKDAEQALSEYVHHQLKGDGNKQDTEWMLIPALNRIRHRLRLRDRPSREFPHIPPEA